MGYYCDEEYEENKLESRAALPPQQACVDLSLLKMASPTRKEDALMEKQVSESLKRFDAAVRSSIFRTDQGERDKQQTQCSEESVDALVSRISADRVGADAPQRKYDYAHIPLLMVAVHFWTVVYFLMRGSRPMHRE